MSHISTYKFKIQSINLLLRTCEDRGYQVLRGQQTVYQYGRNKVEAVASFSIPGWRYPIAVTDKGELKYDHWGSQPNTMDLLGETIQEYNKVDILQSIPYHEVIDVTESKDKDDKIEILLTYN